MIVSFRLSLLTSSSALYYGFKYGADACWQFSHSINQLLLGLDSVIEP